MQFQEKNDIYSSSCNEFSSGKKEVPCRIMQMYTPQRKNTLKRTKAGADAGTPRSRRHHLPITTVATKTTPAEENFNSKISRKELIYSQQ